MVSDPAAGASFQSTIAPWLSVRNSAQAVATEAWWRGFTPEARGSGRGLCDGAQGWCI